MQRKREKEGKVSSPFDYVEPKVEKKEKTVGVTPIKELMDGMKKVCVHAKIMEKTGTREVHGENGLNTLATAVVADESGSITLTLWNDDIGLVQVGDNISVENGYVTSYKGANQLNVGKYGKLQVK